MEEWRRIEGFNGEYEVSNMGQIRRTRNGSTYIIKPNDNGKGYLIIHFRMDGKRKVRYVHRLVATAFVDNPNKKPVVNHINHDKKDNRPANLEWCTQKENVNYSRERMKGRRSATHSNTGERYISKRGSRYRVTVDRVEKSAPTFEAAIAMRDLMLRKGVV